MKKIRWKTKKHQKRIEKAGIKEKTKIKNFLKRFLKNDGIIYRAIKKVYHFLQKKKRRI